MEIAEIRRLRLEALVAEQKGKAKQRELAAAIGKAPAQVSQWINGTRTINEASARAIEKKLKLNDRWMDNDPDFWPFKLVSRARYEALAEQDKAYVQGAMMQAIAEREAPAGGHHSSVAPEAQTAVHLHEPPPKYATKGEP